MLPVQTIATSVMAELIRRQPASKERTAFAWSMAVGPALSRATTVELRNGRLFVTARDPRWALEIERANDTILKRVQLLLGPEAVRGIYVNA
jgi:predicted nucleic acid-binding Zn ribbon protein